MIKMMIPLFVLSVLVASFRESKHKKEQTKAVQQSDTVMINDTVFDMDTVVSEEVLVRFCKDRNIKHIAILVSQAKLESGFRSNIFVRNNNLFGMRLAKQRPTTANGSKQGYAFYDNWKMSVFDYVLWQHQNTKGKSESEYIQLLGDIYGSEK